MTILFYSIFVIALFVLANIPVQDVENKGRETTFVIIALVSNFLFASSLLPNISSSLARLI